MAHPEASVDELVDTCGALARSLSGVR